MISMSIGGFVALSQGGEQTEAEALTQEGIEAVRSIRDNAWNQLTFTTSSVSASSSEWIFSGEVTTETIGQYTRTISLDDVCRDSDDSIVDCPGSYTDLHTKKVLVTVEWEVRPGVTNTVEKITYLTNWDSNTWTQTDWIGGTGQSIWTDETKYDSDDSNIDYSTAGEVKLLSQAGGCGEKAWVFDNASSYTYDSQYIEVTGGVAQLIQAPGSCSGTPTTCDSYSDDISCTGQSGCAWSGGGGAGYCANIGSCSAEPPGQCNSTCGGAGCVRSQGQCGGTLDCSQYTTQIDCGGCGQCSWLTGGSCSGTPTTCDSYSDDISCTGQSGCAWSGGGYTNNNPSINPTGSYTADSAQVWSSFTETATKNGGEIYYQLSDDGGTTWYYWNGSTWSVAGATNYNTASTVNTNISTFNTSTRQINFKAFLSSDGTQQVQLDEVSISCAQSQGWGFDVPADYAYDSGQIEVTSSLAQLVYTSGGGSCSGSPTACNNYSDEISCTNQGGCLWGGGSTESTLNSGFDSGVSSWTIGSLGASYSWQVTGGNPGGYVQGIFPSTKNQVYYYYVHQAFVVGGIPDSVTISFDHIISQYTGNADSILFYVYVDTNPSVFGTPVFTSTDQSSVTSWISETNIDATSKITGPGTYYLKVRAVVDYKNSGPNRSYTLGIDNVSLSWGTASTCSGTPTVCSVFSSQTSCTNQSGCNWTGGAPGYVDTNPAIYPNSSVSVASTSLGIWSSFTETATKNGGEIYYQLSDDGGNTWYYWNGSTWSTAGATNYNTASTINTNISTFNTSTGQINFKAFLSSDGSAQVQLDEVRVFWSLGTIGGGSGYSTSGFFLSSAYNMGDLSPLQIIEWDEDVSSCDPNCDIQLQVRVAPDSAGLPGSWTNWYGVSGSGSYFIDPLGSLISTDLNFYSWVQYRVELTGDGTETPVLQEVRVNYK